MKESQGRPEASEDKDTRSVTEIFTELYELNMPKIFRYFSYRTSDIHLAEDLTSVVFEKALTKFGLYQSDKASFVTWLFAIARNTLIDYYRKSRRQVTIPLEDYIVGSSEDNSPENEALKREEIKKLKMHLSSLPPREQEIVSLKFGAEMTNRQIAGILGLSESNVGIILYRTVRKLRNSFMGWQNG